MMTELGPNDEITPEDLDLIGSDGDKEGSASQDPSRVEGPDDGEDLG